jgi:hypothetical protein
MFTEDFLRDKLKHFSIPQNECGNKVWEIATILFGTDEHIVPFLATEYHSKVEVIVAILKALENGKIGIIWLDTGLIRPDQRAQHCFFVFENDPLRFFTIFQNPGPVFFNNIEDQIDNTIRNAIDHVVRLHIVP